MATRWTWLLTLAALPCALWAQEPPKDKLAPVNHIIVFYLENHSFDNLLGTFPGADGIATAGSKTIQTDENGTPYKTLPHVLNYGKPDARFPDVLPNMPFAINAYAKPSELIGDLVHRFYQTQAQIHGGVMDRFVAAGDAGALTMGYYENKDAPLWKYAARYTLADHFFVGAFGGSFLNHFWLVCACTPRYENGPKELRATLDANGKLLHDGSLTPDGYAVNTLQPFTEPYESREANPARRLPLQTMPTIGDRLSDKNISWAWYGGGWADAATGKPDPSFRFHHHPFGYFANYAQGTKGRAEHLKDEKDFVQAIATNTLPAVAFYKPLGKTDLHPGYSKLEPSEAQVFALVEQIEHSPEWKDSVIIVTFDDAGGFWDHVAPPAGDRFGPGERIPTLIISPFAKRGYIDHTTYDTTSILKFIEKKYGLTPLGDRDAKANDLTNALK